MIFTPETQESVDFVFKAYIRNRIEDIIFNGVEVSIILRMVQNFGDIAPALPQPTEKYLEIKADRRKRWEAIAELTQMLDDYRNLIVTVKQFEKKTVYYLYGEDMEPTHTEALMKNYFELLLLLCFMRDRLPFGG